MEESEEKKPAKKEEKKAKAESEQEESQAEQKERSDEKPKPKEVVKEKQPEQEKFVSVPEEKPVQKAAEDVAVAPKSTAKKGLGAKKLT